MLAIVTRVFSTFVQTLSDPCDSHPSHTATTFNMVKQESSSLSSQHLTKYNLRTIKCYCCDATFISVSSMFYHLENESCPSGINRQDIEKLTTYYLNYLQYQGVFLYYCGRCRRPFRSMFDLLRHVEDVPCMRLGLYGRGSLIDYIATNIGSLTKIPIERNDTAAVRTTLPDSKENEEFIIKSDSDSIRGNKAKETGNNEGGLIPRIIITRVDGSTIKW
ncbi:predicted protein [Histoplasma capsulatum var. duboisii H88]|uniref:Predicted protein n=2 Tax=Ajellomyces capsulatus TaxID=5037 RepID=F0UV81_AJEC8|nr:predicted protein [Histoplasma capsulatum var. duboisii H88]